MTQVNQLDFSNEIFFCGIDVHKKNWQVNIRTEAYELENYNQDADVKLFYQHITTRYPKALFKVCYEAGFSGFSVQRWLSQKGVECIVVNAADVITTHKDRRRKTDQVDARKLAMHLQSKRAVGIHVPHPNWEHSRSLVRTREKLTRDKTRCKNRIWQSLYFAGLELPAKTNNSSYWSKRFVNTLKEIDCGNKDLQASVHFYIQEFESIRDLQLGALKAIRQMCRRDEYKADIELIRSIPGIGLVNAAVVLFEIQDINRFKNFDSLCSYVGLVPDIEQSGDSSHVKGITGRRNAYLRSALVESAWQVIRKDPALLLKFKQYCKRMESNKAIVRIAKHLLSRIRYVLKNRVEYEIGVVK